MTQLRAMESLCLSTGEAEIRAWPVCSNSNGWQQGGHELPWMLLFPANECISNKVLTFLFLGHELVMTNEGRGSACGWVQAAKSCSSSGCTSHPVLLSMTTGQLNRPFRADVKGQGFGHQIITATKIASLPHPFLPT